MTKKYNLEKILPHKPPMILIDELLEVDTNKVTAKAAVTISEDKIFYDKELCGISSLAGIEFMAQTIGCCAYFMNGEKEPEVGFLLGSRMYKTFIEKFELNKTYTVSVTQVFSDNQLVSFECFIYNGDVECACATVNVYQPRSSQELQMIEV